MSGTLATYQSFPCRDVRFRRSRGWTADTSTVLLFAADFPRGFEFVTPEPGAFDQLSLQTRAAPDLSVIQGRVRPNLPLPKARRLEFAGALVLAEVDDQGNSYVVVVEPLFCVALETVRRNADGSVAVVRARLVDARYFASLGFVRRWSFNRTSGGGEIALDSVKSSGELFTVNEVARLTAESLFLAPELKRTPEIWSERRLPVELGRFAPATVALARLAQQHGAEPLCLNLDGSVALWEAGEGSVGYAPDGEGVGNPRLFPTGLQLYLNGQGQSQGTEATYPPDHVLVVGGLRVATVVMDRLDPVLAIDDTAIPLTEETVRKLTAGKHGLAWLNAFVLAPQAYQNAVDVDSRVVQLFREQAYRLWRVPDVEREVADEGLEGSVVLPGPNAHLLPLRGRAELAGGKRLPVRVDSYRFASVHRAMASSKAAQAVSNAQRILRQLKQEIQALARKANKQDPWNGLEAFFLFQDKYVTPRLLYTLSGVWTREVSFEQFQSMLARARLIERIREVSPGLASKYDRTLGALFEVDAKQGGSQKTLYELAKELVAFEKQVAESRDLLETPDAEAKDREQELRDLMQSRLRELARQQQGRATQTRIGAQARSADQTAVFLRNLPREHDPDAQVYSARLGIVRTSEPSGHLKKEGVPIAEATTFVPRSPLVYFGAVLRPRVDRAPATPNTPRRPTTGSPPASERGADTDETEIPSVLSDQESYYTAAFKRLRGGLAQQIELDEIPNGQGVPLERPDLVELVPLNGRSNREQLNATAEQLALGLFRKPEQVERAKYSLARPWPVNCDGVVSGVEITLRPQGKGFVTTIYTGGEAPLLDPPGRTRVRPRRDQGADAQEREGLVP